MSDEKPAVDLVTAETALRLANVRLERKELRKRARATKLDNWITGIKLDAARIVKLRQLAFVDDNDPEFAKLSTREKALVRQWQEPKRNAAFAIESAARLLDSEVRARGEEKKIGINVERLIVKLPSRGGAELPEPITVEADK